MAAFVVVAPTGSPSPPGSGTRLNLFPGSGTPAVFTAGAPFWIGYGFVTDPSGAADGKDAVDDATGFELLVDGESVALSIELEVEDGRTVRKFAVADFSDGLPAGWHRLAGRWYHAGVLALTSDRSIEFVER